MSMKNNRLIRSVVMEKKKLDSKILWQLFKSTFILSASTFGGGFVIVSLMKKEICRGTGVARGE